MADEGTFSCFSVGSIAGTYEEIYVPRIFVPWAGLLLERAALRPGEAVLDIATGPGTVARIVAEQVGPQGRVVGADSARPFATLAASPIAGTIAGLDADTGSRLRSAAARHLAPLVADGQVGTQMVSNLLTATKPNRP